MSEDTSPLDYLRNLHPPEAPRFWETGDGRLMAWNEYGDPAGRPLMYYHGWPSSRLQAGRYVSRIAAAELTVDPEEGHFSLAIHRTPAAKDHLASQG